MQWKAAKNKTLISSCTDEKIKTNKPLTSLA